MHFELYTEILKRKNGAERQGTIRLITVSFGFHVLITTSQVELAGDGIQTSLSHQDLVVTSPICSWHTSHAYTETPIEVEQQVDVITMETYDPEDIESDPESIEYENGLGEQIPDEEVAVGAMEVTVWSTEDHETPPTNETEDIINQSSSNIQPSSNVESGHAPSGSISPTPFTDVTNHSPLDVAEPAPSGVVDEHSPSGMVDHTHSDLEDVSHSAQQVSHTS